MTDRAKPGESPGTTMTLGDLLFADGESPPSESTWVALVRSIAAGDKRALHALFHRTHKLVFTLVMRITKSQETAEELTLDVFHDVWRRAPDYDAANGSVIGWLLNQARSRAIDRLRFDQRKKRVDPNPGQASGEEDAPGPDHALELEERGRALRGALALLTREEREAIETAYFGGLTYAETATRLDQPLGTVKTRIRNGLDKLRQSLGKDAR